MNTRVKVLLVAITGLILTSCASLISGNSDNIIINTEPNGAAVVVIKPGDFSLDSIIESHITPTIINLPRGNGPFRPAEYMLMFHKDGYIDDSIIIHSRINGLYFGNFIIGGTIGLLIDPITGAMWDLPNSVNFKLIPIK